eukprot:4220367-Amphidinium_carterae.1
MSASFWNERYTQIIQYNPYEISNHLLAEFTLEMGRCGALQYMLSTVAWPQFYCESSKTAARTSRPCHV